MLGLHFLQRAAHMWCEASEGASDEVCKPFDGSEQTILAVGFEGNRQIIPTLPIPMDLEQRMGVDWKHLAADVSACRIDRIQSLADGMLDSQKQNYRVLQRALKEYLFGQVHPPLQRATATSYILCCDLLTLRHSTGATLGVRQHSACAGAQITLFSAPQVSAEDRIIFILTALPQIQRKEQHLFAELLQPSVQGLTGDSAAREAPVDALMYGYAHASAAAARTCR